MLVVYFAVLLVVADRSGDGNTRHSTLLGLGARTAERSAHVTDDGSDLTLDGTATSASATWNEFSYEIGHLLERSLSCDMRVAIVGAGLTSANGGGSADVLVNGADIQHIVFGSGRRGLYPLAGARLVPANISPQPIELVPLDAEYGFVVSVPQRYCKAHALTIGVRVRDATWKIAHAGILLAYTPAPFPAAKAALFGAVGSVVIVVSIVLLFFVLARFSSLGLAPLAIASVVLALAPLAYDQWDFRIWMTFGETAVFGAGDPAYLWYGSPLWTFVPGIFSTMTAATFVLAGNGAQASTAIFMKVAMGIAYCYSAYQIAARAPARLRATYAVVALLLPVGLYELAGGYRELFATAIAIGSLTAASRHRKILATLLAVVAASISEELLPLAMLPAALALCENGTLRRRTAAAGLTILAFVLFLAQWKFLLPHDLATNALAYRFGSAPLGGASWGGSLNGLGLLPSWLPVRSPIFDAVLFLALATFPGLRLAKTIFGRHAVADAVLFDRIVGVFIALVASFLLAFRGTDPNLWYSLSAITFWYFASAHPRSPFPLVLGSIEGLALYAIVGLREFVNQSFFWPVDVGLLGTLSTSRYVFDLMANALLLGLIVNVSMGSARGLFSPKTPFIALVFAAAVTATATATYLLDGIVLVAVVALVASPLRRAAKAEHERPDVDDRTSLARGASIVALAATGAFAGTRSGLAGLCATATSLVASRVRFGICDVVLGMGAIAVLGAQTGMGIVSEFGIVLLIAIVVVGVATTLVRVTPYR